MHGMRHGMMPSHRLRGFGQPFCFIVVAWCSDGLVHLVAAAHAQGPTTVILTPSGAGMHLSRDHHLQDENHRRVMRAEGPSEAENMATIQASALGDAIDFPQPDPAPATGAFEEQLPSAAPGLQGLNDTDNFTGNISQLTEQFNLERESDVATTIGVMLLGLFTFFFSLFYATHFPDKDVRYATWLTMSETVSLFSAVLLFSCVKTLFVLQFGETGGGHDGVPDTWSLVLTFIRMLLVFWGVEMALMKYRKRPLPLLAAGSIGGNVMAFAAIDSYGMIQQFPPFSHNPMNAFLGLCIAAFMILCMGISAHIVRKYVMTYEDGEIKEHEQKWHEQCQSTEDQFAAMTLGLLLSIVIRYGISGQLPAIWGSPRNKTQTQVWTLLGVALGFSVPTFAATLAVGGLQNHSSSIPGVLRAAKVFQKFMSMTMGWCLTYWGQWQFWAATDGRGVGLGDKMTARIIDALAFSYIGFVLILGLDWIADRVGAARSGFDAIQQAFILGLGISWQGAFSEAVESMAYNFQDINVRAYMEVLITIVLLTIVLPAWILYLLPKALAGPDAEDASKPGTEEKSAEGEQAASNAPAGGVFGEERGAQQEQQPAAAPAAGAGPAQPPQQAPAAEASDTVEVQAEAEPSAEGGGASGAGSGAAASVASGSRGSTSSKGGGKAAASGGKGVKTGKATSQEQSQEQPSEQPDETWQGEDDSGGGEEHYMPSF